MVVRLRKRGPARRGTRRRPRRESALVWWVLFAVLAALAWWLQSWRAGLLVLLGWCLYQLVLVPTVCRVLTQQGAACTERARGRLFACGPDHQRFRNSALWRLAGLRDPFGRPEPEPAAPGGTPGDAPERGVVVVSPEVRGRLVPQDRALILLAVAGTVAALAGAVYGLR